MTPRVGPSCARARRARGSGGPPVCGLLCGPGWPRPGVKMSALGRPRRTRSASRFAAAGAHTLPQPERRAPRAEGANEARRRSARATGTGPPHGRPARAKDEARPERRQSPRLAAEQHRPHSLGLPWEAAGQVAVAQRGCRLSGPTVPTRLVRPSCGPSPVAREQTIRDQAPLGGRPGPGPRCSESPPVFAQIRPSGGSFTPRKKANIGLSDGPSSPLDPRVS